MSLVARVLVCAFVSAPLAACSSEKTADPDAGVIGNVDDAGNTILPDGAVVLPDGAVVHPDGSAAGDDDASLSDGAVDDAGGDDANSGDSGASCDNIVGDRATQVCLRWKCDRMNLSEGTWNGDVGTCTAGEISSDARESSLRLVNLYRFLGDLPPVTEDATQDTKAQAASLMMHANGALNHTPPNTWLCYTADGADGAHHSNLTGGGITSGIDGFMSDWGNETTLGHRRNILSNFLHTVGMGSTHTASALYVSGAFPSAGKSWMAWPPVGKVPIDAITIDFPVDSTGWSLMSDVTDVTNATITVTRDGTTNLPVTTNALDPNYGAYHAVRWVANGWTTEAGHTYTVSATGISTPITYDVEVISCP